MRSSRRKPNFLPVSLVILLIIFLQTAVTFRLIFPPFRDPQLWPFLTYPMYKEPHFQGSAIKEYFVYGILEDGREVAITPEDVGLKFWLFRKNAIAPLIERDRDKIIKFAEFYESLYQQKLKQLRLENHPTVIDRYRHSPGEIEVLRTIDVINN